MRKHIRKLIRHILKIIFEGKTEVGRYVMFFFTSMNSRAGLNSVSVRKVQIWHKAITNVTMSASTLDLKAGDEAQQLTATVTT